MMFRFFKKKIVGVTLSLAIIVSGVFAPLSASLELNRADAILVEDLLDLGFDIKTSIEQTIGTISQLADEFYGSQDWLKETVLDAIAWQLANAVLKEMIKSVTKWVNSGFKGSPTFVTDMNGFLTDVADKAAGNFIYGSGLEGLCSPFKFDIKLALHTQYEQTRDYKAQCTLSSAVNNVQNFFNGDFLEGGWDGWYKVTMEPQNNPYGALLDTSAQLDIKIKGAKDKQLSILNFGNGFLSMRDPNCANNETVEDPYSCPIVTPGNVIQTQLNETLNIPAGRLQVADEINELIGALFSQLVSQALSGAGGLLGLTESGYGGNSGSYFGRLEGEPEPGETVPNEAFNKALEEERAYLAVVNRAVELLLEASAYKDETYGDDNSCHSGRLTAALQQKLVDLRKELRDSNDAVTKLQNFKFDFELLNGASTSPQVLEALYTKYGASSTPGAKAKLMGQFNALRSSGTLHNARELVELRDTVLPDLEKQVEELKEDIDRDCAGSAGNPSSIVPVPNPWNQIFQGRAASREVKAYRVPTPPDGRASIVFTQGQGTQIPSMNPGRAIKIEYYVSRTPGVIPSSISEGDPNYSLLDSGFVNNNNMTIYVREVPPIRTATVIRSTPGLAYAPGSGPWYINVRWTYDYCSFSACGFSLQWALGSD